MASEPNKSTSKSDRTSHDVTLLLNRAAQGDEQAARQIFPLIYEELRAIARSKQRPGNETLRATALVHEAYLRILKREPQGWQERSHFFHAAARAMRDILVEDARRRKSGKHGGGLHRFGLDEIGICVIAPPDEVLSLQACLRRLETEDEVGHDIVMLRYFVGLTISETAEVLQQSVRTIERKWTFVRSWLSTEMAADQG